MDLSLDLSKINRMFLLCRSLLICCLDTELPAAEWVTRGEHQYVSALVFKRERCAASGIDSCSGD